MSIRVRNYKLLVKVVYSMKLHLNFTIILFYLDIKIQIRLSSRL